MSSRTPARSGRRNYDKESGMDRVRKPKSKKVQVVSESEEDFSSEEEEDVRVAKKKLVHKDYKEDARRPRPKKQAAPSSDEEDETLGTGPTTKQSGTADRTSASDSSTPVAAHMVLLNVMDKVGKYRPVHHALNTFTVNFSVMFTLLDGLQRSLTGNTRINNYFPEYFSLGTRIYYAYLGYYQILRAKLASNVPLDAVERRVYRKLETTLPLESCPVAGPLVGWFQALGAYKPSDKTYNWVYPVVQPFTVGDTLFSLRAGQFFYPNVPLMVAFMSTLARIPNNAAQYINQSGYIVPVRNQANAAIAWLGEQWELDQATASGNGILNHFVRPGLSIALPEQASYLSGPRISSWRRVGIPQIVQTQNCADLENFLLCAGNANLNWLRTLRNWANAESKFAKGSVNLSQISPTCGSHVLAITEFIDPTANPTEITEPWITGNNDYYQDKPFTTRSVSAAVDNPDLDRAHTYRIVVEVEGTGNRLPARIANQSGLVEGPLYRYEVPAGTYTGNLRSRWKIEADHESGFDSDLQDLINLHIYSPMGEEPEPVQVRQ